MSRAWYIVLLAAVAIGPGTSRAQGGGPLSSPPAAEQAAEQLRRAAAALQAGAHDEALALAAPLTGADSLSRSDRAEALRIQGLALFFLGRHGDAEAALLAYLEVDLDAHLDPALVPPEAIVFFEDVRSRHAAHLRALRPKPTRRRYALLNALPPAGQFQNGHRTKGIVLGATEAALLSVNLGTYLVLRSWCSGDGTCTSGERDRTDQARLLRTANLLSGALFAATYIYGVVDGLVHHRRTERAPDLSVTVLPVTTGIGGALSLSGRF